MEKESDFFSPIAEKPRRDYEKLSQLLSEVSFKINAEAEADYGAKDLLLPDGSVRIDNFDAINGGIYDSDTIKGHNQNVKDIELSLSCAQNERTAEHYKTEFGCENQGQIIAQWKKGKQKNQAACSNRRL